MKGFPVQGFEAQRWLSRLCRASYALNYVTAKCFHQALSDRDGHADLAAPHIDGGGGSIVCDFIDAVIHETVSVIPLDEHNGSSKSISFMKIDVEGAELDVLRGAQRTIRKSRPTIVFECWENEVGQRKEELFRFINDDLDYKVTPVSWWDTFLAEPKD